MRRTGSAVGARVVGVVAMGALWAACGAGPKPETLLTELRIVAVVAEPPEAMPGEEVAYEVVVADPAGVGFELLLWTCGEVCAVGRGDLSLPALAPVVWALACEVGQCGDLDGVEEARLRDPVGWLVELPLTGVSAATRPLIVSDRPAEARRVNPVVEEAPDEVVVVGDAAELRFRVPGAEAAWGTTTSGGFGMVRYDVSSAGEVTLEWFPDGAGSATLYVVFEDGEGGTAVWSTTTTGAGG